MQPMGADERATQNWRNLNGNEPEKPLCTAIRQVKTYVPTQILIEVHGEGACIPQASDTPATWSRRASYPSWGTQLVH
ncbi:hypothetical protein SCLCIDRAFT_1223934 [Scleroderma citrinum Foug A]|uniref:Uncharacterized protein n=1 Tax=Scleroderma citrinum Foug A TaxID=1036808 RepID=A0A0C2ZHG5_9AGAM|nr:hypothetical protein SCLCIDRAFT_1223934 [Scleroderma citrinum Foug A]